jgi:UDP-N-acetylmuramyl tripeptide synthase
LPDLDFFDRLSLNVVREGAGLMEVSRSGLFSGKRGSGRVMATGFFPGKLEEHYEDHLDDFKTPLTIEDYEARAKNFFSKEPPRTTEYFYDVDGVLYRYDKRTNEFGTCRADGIMITYFFPRNKLIYWYRQVEQYAI